MSRDVAQGAKNPRPVRLTDFTIRGEYFVPIRPSRSLIARAAKNLEHAGPVQEIWDCLDAVVVLFLDDDSRLRWRRVREREEDPITVSQLRALAGWLMSTTTPECAWTADDSVRRAVAHMTRRVGLEYAATTNTRCRAIAPTRVHRPRVRSWRPRRARTSRGSPGRSGRPSPDDPDLAGRRRQLGVVRGRS